MHVSPFHVGQKVVCVRAKSTVKGCYDSLRRGQVYTVRAIEVTEWINGVRLVGFHDGPAPFAASRFVPADPAL